MRIRHLPLGSFKELAKKDEYSPDSGVKWAVPKYLPDSIEKADDDAAEDSRERTFIISTPAVDRERDTIAIDGWELDNFRSSGPVLWAHESWNPPVATPKDTFVENGKLKSRASFLDAETNAFADSVFRMIKAGALKATSVGFMPKEWSFNEERGGWAIDFTRQELLEWSIVPVPANPEALLDGKMLKGIDLRPIYDWAEAHLDGAEEAKLLVPRYMVEETAKALRPQYAAAKTVKAEVPEDGSLEDVIKALVENHGNEAVLRAAGWTPAAKSGDDDESEGDDDAAAADTAAGDVDDAESGDAEADDAANEGSESADGDEADDGSDEGELDFDGSEDDLRTAVTEAVREHVSTLEFDGTEDELRSIVVDAVKGFAQEERQAMGQLP